MFETNRIILGSPKHACQPSWLGGYLRYSGKSPHIPYWGRFERIHHFEREIFSEGQCKCWKSFELSPATHPKPEQVPGKCRWSRTRTWATRTWAPRTWAPRSWGIKPKTSVPQTMLDFVLLHRLQRSAQVQSYKYGRWRPKLLAALLICLGPFRG